MAIEDVGGLERRQPARAPGGRLASNVGNRGPSRSLPGRLTGSQTPLSLRKCRRRPTWDLVATGSAGSPSGSAEQPSSQASAAGCGFLGSGALQLPEPVVSAPPGGRWLKSVVGKA